MNMNMNTNIDMNTDTNMDMDKDMDMDMDMHMDRLPLRVLRETIIPSAVPDPVDGTQTAPFSNRARPRFGDNTAWR